MNSNETQLALVLEKVNALCGKVEALDGRIEDIFSWQRNNAKPLSPSGANYQALNHDLSSHKDVISDEKQRPGDRETSGSALGADIQIQRLTAQLTAAYGRIAALEEQLLARREPQT